MIGVFPANKYGEKYGNFPEKASVLKNRPTLGS